MAELCQLFVEDLDILNFLTAPMLQSLTIVGGSRTGEEEGFFYGIVVQYHRLLPPIGMSSRELQYSHGNNGVGIIGLDQRHLLF